MNCLLKITFVAFVTKCYSVDTDYYLAADITVEEEQNTTNITSRKSNEKPIIVKTINDNQLLLGGEIYSPIAISPTVPQTTLSMLANVTSTLAMNISTVAYTMRLQTNVTKKKKLKLDFNIYAEYDYMFDKNFTDYDGVTSMSTLEDTVTRSTDATQAFLAGFYNLVPAAGIVPVKKHSSQKTSNNSWYVQEELPCWEIPYLYAELGSKASSEVFRIHDRTLKNVIEKESSFTHSKKIVLNDVEFVKNRWCGEKPCFGDHILCLFKEKYSVVCNSDYKVRVPVVVMKIALVNTINAMRNRVAKGQAKEYPQLPTASNMQQMIYDNDLQNMAKVWLHQCLPGPAPCSSLEGGFASQLECTKHAKECCHGNENNEKPCIPKNECYIHPIIGCIYAWYSSAGKNLEKVDIACGHAEPGTYNTIQLLTAHTNKVGCAYAKDQWGNVRVVCNFAPSAPFIINTDYYCGLIKHKDVTTEFKKMGSDVKGGDRKILEALGVILKPIELDDKENKIAVGDLLNIYAANNLKKTKGTWGVQSLIKGYPEGWRARVLGDVYNGTSGVVARLVTKYTFSEDTRSKCDNDMPVYHIGKPGSMCSEISRRYHSLCYDYRDPTPGYRLIAVLAPMALFSLILYDLFSGVMRQVNS